MDGAGGTAAKYSNPPSEKHSFSANRVAQPLDDTPVDVSDHSCRFTSFAGNQKVPAFGKGEFAFLSKQCAMPEKT